MRKPRTIAASCWRQHRLRADDLGDDPAPVDIARQHHRHLRSAGKAHIGDVSAAQIDLRRAARALHDDQIMGGFQAMEALQHRGHQLRFQRGIRPRLYRGDAPPCTTT
jgi:hypothetical protein